MKKSLSPTILLGVGRSGTTLVQRILNSYNKTLIWGEHAGFLNKTAESYELLLKNKSMDDYSFSQNNTSDSGINIDFYKDPNRWQAWNNWFSKKDIRSIYQESFTSIFNPLDLNDLQWGFKEIRYGNLKTLSYIADLFPQAKFIFVVRHPLNTIESQLNTFHQGESKYLSIKRIIQLPIAIKIALQWSHDNKAYFDFSKKHPANTHLIKYEDFISGKEGIENLASFLNTHVSADQENILSLSEGRGSSYSENGNENERWKRLGAIPLLILKPLTKNTGSLFGYNL